MVSSDKISIRTSVLKSLQNYAKYVGEFGMTTSQDKLKLLVMIFLYDTLLNSSYIYDVESLQKDYAGFNVSKNNRKADYIWDVFFNVMGCLRNNSCCVIAAEPDECKGCPVDDPDIGIYTTELLGTNNLDGNNLVYWLMATNSSEIVSDRQSEGDSEESDGHDESSETVESGESEETSEGDESEEVDENTSDESNNEDEEPEEGEEESEETPLNVTFLAPNWYDYENSGISGKDFTY